MSRLLPALLVLLLLAAGARARDITDHEGYRVTLPDAPRRIVSLHDWTLTVMAHELNAPLLASTGRLGPDGVPFMRGARELFGLDFSQVALAAIFGRPDLEHIRSLKPDLILANSGDNTPLRAQLATIAPTLMFDAESGRPPLALYADLAGWLGRTARFEALKAAYERRLAEVRARILPPGAPAPTYAVMLINPRDGTVQVVRTYGVLTTALDDLGFRPMPIVAGMGRSNRMTISPELIDALDADILFTTYLPPRHGGVEEVNADMDRIAPGARATMKAFAAGRVINLPRYEVYPVSFRGLHRVLEAIAATVHETGSTGDAP
ncbi:protein translocase component YidC [Azorhizobium oxalatiphilum]|uniref:Protein translocase component YidC n=1 Tax=Azorhizobium oxalatiphilum TaxID=980631 RepID=A0A917C6X1_9HYPH|nr:ABC transporter substrate-binding protein [Azorhizobium oxalatiphilum]GGF75175.1 protein translocase component YidC [Azorhizobium oxalatiphilum]